MAHLLTMAAGAVVSATTAISRRERSAKGSCKRASSDRFSLPVPTIYASVGCQYHQASASHEALLQHQSVSVPRRTLIISGTMLLGLSLSSHSRNARAAARRPPPPPQEDKKDPNVSGVQAKVLASKKRKEALKQTVAKLREKGTLIEQATQSQ